jgi:Predicted membrane protein
MALNKSSNPTLKDSIFTKVNVSGETQSGVMTVKGSIMKSVFLLLLVLLAGACTWSMVQTATSQSAIIPWIGGGAIVGFILALIICFKPQTAPYLAPVYAVAEGLFLGAISAVYELAYAATYPGIVLTAVAITLLTALVMLITYRTGLIKVTAKFRSVIIISTVSIAVFYLATIVLSFLGVSTPFVHGTGWLSIGISVFIVIIAALNLLLDFDFIEKGSSIGVPKYMEWYGAFGLTVTLVWLYLEILRLLSKLADRS